MPPLKIRYGILALTSSTHDGGMLHYNASFGASSQIQQGWKERYTIITIQPRAGDASPSFQIVDTPPHANLPPEPTPLRAAGGQSVLIANTPPGQPHQPARIYITNKLGKRFFPAPVPTLAQFQNARSRHRAPNEIQSEIGPFVLDGPRAWFANSFYDGEGVSGVGAIGSFDTLTHLYEMRYLPEITPWSGSAILLDGEDLWIGLMRRPEGASTGSGLLRYNTKTRAVAKYAIPDLIYTIDRLGETLYCGTSQGLYTIHGGKITQLRFEPDEKGNTAMVARAVE
jgi:hypothetical protein